MPHPGNDGGCGPVLDRDSLRPGHGAATDRGGVIGNRAGQLTGEISVSQGERPGTSPPPCRNLRRIRPELYSGVGHLHFCVWRSPRWIARLRDRHESCRWWPPLPKRPVRKPCGPSSPERPNDPRPALTRRVKAASPGGSRIQPSGAVSTSPSADRTDFGVGPGVKMFSVNLATPAVPFPEAVSIG